MRNLRLTPWPGQTDSACGLVVSWTPAHGDLDMYVVSLSTAVSPDRCLIHQSSDGRGDRSVVTSCLQKGAVMETRPVPKHVSTLDFLDLVPGTAYSLTVQSLSGKLTNSSTATGRTGRTSRSISVVSWLISVDID